MFKATFVIFQLYRGGQFDWWRKPEYPMKTTDLRQIVLNTHRHEQDSILNIRLQVMIS